MCEMKLFDKLGRFSTEALKLSNDIRPLLQEALDKIHEVTDNEVEVAFLLNLELDSLLIEDHLIRQIAEARK